MNKIFMIFAIVLLFSNQSFACFEVVKKKLEHHLYIGGLTVNHRLVFLGSKNQELKIGKIKVNGSEKQKIFNTQADTLRLIPDSVSKNEIFKIYFLDYKKEIQIEVDAKTAGTKSVTRGENSSCGGKLTFKKY